MRIGTENLIDSTVCDLRNYVYVFIMMPQLSFEAVTGDSWDSDIALDEITWETGQCGN